MKPLHEELREIRLDKGVTLEKIHELTKINLPFLQKIEEGDFSMVPQPFLRAFLREFAEVLEVDPERVMMRYDNKIQFIREPEVSEPKREETAREEKPADIEPKNEQTADKEAETKSVEHETKTETLPDEPDLPGEVDAPEMTEPESIVQSPEIESEATEDSGHSTDTITQPSLFESSSERSGEEHETLVQQPASEIQSEEASSTESNVPAERQRLTIEDPDKSNAVFIIVAVVLIIIAAVIIFWLSP